MPDTRIPTWEESTPVQQDSATTPTWEQSSPIPPKPTWEESTALSPKEKPLISADRVELGDRWIKDKEITDIADKYKVSADTLRLGVDMKYASREPTSLKDAAVHAVRMGLGGSVSEALGGAAWTGIKQLAYDKNTQKALDEVEELAEKRKDVFQKTVPMLLPTLPLVKGGTAAISEASAALKAGEYVKAALPLAKAAAAGAPVGAVFGYGSSTEDNRLRPTLIGAALGAATTAGMPVAEATLLTPLIRKLGGAASGKEVRAIAENVERKLVDKEEAGLKDIYTEAQAGREWKDMVQPDMADAVLTPGEMEHVLEIKAHPGEQVVEPELAEQKIAEYKVKKVEQYIEAELKKGGDAAEYERRLYREATDEALSETGLAAKYDGKEHLLSEYIQEQAGAKYKDYGRFFAPHDIGKVMEDANKAMELNAAGEHEVVSAVMAHIKGEEYAAPNDLGKYILNDIEKYTKMQKSMLRAHNDWSIDKIDEELSALLLSKEEKNLAKQLDPGALRKEDVMDVLRSHLEAKTGPEQMEKIYRDSRMGLYMGQAVDKDLPRLMKAMRTSSMLLDKAMGSQFVAAEADRRAGTTTEAVLSKVSNALDLAHNDSGFLWKAKAQPFLDKIKEFGQFQGKEGHRFLTEIAELGEAGTERAVTLKLITKEEGQVGREFAGLYKDLGEIMREKGLSFRNVQAADGSANYVKHMLVPPEEFKVRVLDAYDTLSPAILARLDKKKDAIRAIIFNPEKYPDSYQLIRSMEIGSGHKILDKEAFLEAAKEIQGGGRELAKRLGLAKASLERSGNIPELVREYDIGRGLFNYIHNSQRTLALRDPLRELGLQIKALEKTGDVHYSSYFKDLTQDLLNGNQTLTGVPKLLSRWKDNKLDKLFELQKERGNIWRTAEAAAIERKESDISGYIMKNTPQLAAKDKEIAKLQAAYDLPDFANNMVRTAFFSNLMGGHIRTGMRELVQPFTVGVQEIGGKYGWSKVTEGIAKSLSTPDRIFKWAEELEKLGMLPKNYLQNMSNMDIDKYFVNKIMQQVKQGAAKYSQLANSFRIATDIADRKIMLEAGRGIAADFMKGGAAERKLASDFINKKMSPAFRTEINQMIKAEASEEALGNKLGEYLINRTRYRYNQVASSEYARRLGPVLTQFTKYPSEVLGSYITSYRRFGAGPMVERIMYPSLSLLALDSLRTLVTDRKDLSPRERVFIYKGGLREFAPVYSMPEIVPGNGPEMETYHKVLDLIRNPEKYEKTLHSLRHSFHPLGAASSFMDDMSRLITGEAPTKD